MERPRGTVTLLFTDIEGSTRLLQDLRERYADVLDEHRELLRAAAREHGGHEVDTQGDAFFFAFARASDAVAAAAQAQRALAGHAWPQGRELRVRMGIHTGEPTATGEGYVGVDVHRAARVMAAGHGGQVVLSQTTSDLLDESALDEIGLRDLGEHRLKDLTERERLYQLVLPGLPSDFPPLETLENRPTNLPTQPTPLIGRQRELAELRALLCRDDVWLVTLTGPGGTGKTRLALQTAAELVEAFPDGVFFVTLAALSDPALVVATIAQTLALREAGGEPLDETLRDYLANRDVLLVLDNFEHLLAGAPDVARVLAGATAKALATSRAPLRVSGERVYAVPPLDVPPADSALDLTSLSRYESVRLLVERASDLRADFRLTADNAPAIAAICARLDGLPLAIELAAARTRVLPPEALLKRLDARLRVLTGGARDLPERQQTLRAAIDWSYGLLSEPEQALFARMAVFRGGRTLEAIEAVCDPKGELGIDVLDGVESLVDKSLLRQDEAPGGEPRFVMLETIHEYAREKLEERGETDELARRHAEWFLVLARESWEHEHGQSPEWLDRLDRERANLRAALEYWREADPERFLELAGSLWKFWAYRGGRREGREWLDEALEVSSRAPTAERERALAGAANLASQVGDRERARAAAEERLVLARALAEPSRIAAALASLGGLAAEAGDSEESIGLLREALAVCRSEGELASLLPAALHNLGYVYERAGDYTRAAEAFGEALGLMPEGSLGRAFTVQSLGAVRLYEGRPDEARPLLVDAVRCARSAGVVGSHPYAVGMLAAADVASGRSLARAGKLLGWFALALEESGLVPQPHIVAVRDRALSALRDQLGDDEFERLAREGRRLGADEAVALALEDSDLS